MSARNDLTVVLPAFNEAQGLKIMLPPLLEQAAQLGWEVLVVDDGSADGTCAVAQELGATVRSHARNKGYGAALKTGIRAASHPLVAIMDADGQHTIEALKTILDQVETADMVVGARRGLAGSPLWRVPGKALLSALARYIARQRIPDLNSGLRVFRRETIMRYLHLFPDGFSFSTTCTLLYLTRGLTIAYVPIHVDSRKGRSTVTPASGIETLLLILRLATLFEPLRLFASLSSVLLVSGVLWAIPYAAAGRGVSLGAALLILMGVQLLFTGLVAEQVASLRKERFE